MRYTSPACSVFCSPPIMKIALPASIMPTCSCGWECSSTTALGSMSTRDIIIFSAAQVRMWTPGKMVCGLNSVGWGKNRLMAGLRAERENASKAEGPCWRCSLWGENVSTQTDSQQKVDLGRLADHKRHRDRFKSNGAQAAAAVDRP